LNLAERVGRGLVCETRGARIQLSGGLEAAHVGADEDVERREDGAVVENRGKRRIERIVLAFRAAGTSGFLWMARLRARWAADRALGGCIMGRLYGSGSLGGRVKYFGMSKT
jgi:hypothetical protein